LLDGCVFIATSTFVQQCNIVLKDDLKLAPSTNLDKLSSSPSRRTGVEGTGLPTSSLSSRLPIFGAAHRPSQVSVCGNNTRSSFLKHHLTPHHPASTPSPSFPIARLWSCATGLNSSFSSHTSTCAPSHSGELGAGLSQTWLSDKSHCTSRSRRWYVHPGTLDN
jgi:hypothetical protein